MSKDKIQNNEQLPQAQEEDKNIANVGQLISTLPKESLKSLLYLAAGRQDSNYRLFGKPIFVETNDLIELNTKIQEKLSHYDTAGIVTVDILFEKNRAKQFGSWESFEEQKWEISEVCESLTIRWDFMYKLPQYIMPQRHTLSVKFLSSVNALHVLQALISKDPVALSDVEIESAPIVVRVDFISHLLSDELINIVEEWVNSRKRAIFISGWRVFFKKFRRPISKSFQYAMPVVYAFFASSILHFLLKSYDESVVINIEILEKSLCWLLYAGVGFLLSLMFGRFFARNMYNALDDYGYHSLFLITNGDKNRRSKMVEENKKEMKKFFTNSIWSIVLNLIAAALAYYFYKS